MSIAQTQKKTLRELRLEIGLNQVELAQMALCSDQAVGQLERGGLRLDSAVGQRVIKILQDLGADTESLDMGLIKEERRQLAESRAVWLEDGFAATTPKRNIAEWCMARNLSRPDLAFLAGLSRRTIENIESGRRRNIQKRTRGAIARALRVHPSKLILPEDRAPTETEIRIEERLRSELRDARRALHKAFDFMRDDANITFKAQNIRDELLPDIQRQMR